MPYEKWKWPDTFWLLLIIVLATINARGFGMSRSECFALGIFTAMVAFGWWRYRESRKETWWAEYRLQRQREDKTL